MMLITLFTDSQTVESISFIFTPLPAPAAADVLSFLSAPEELVSAAGALSPFDGLM